MLCSPTIWLQVNDIPFLLPMHTPKRASFSMHDLFPGMVSGVGMLPQGLPTAKRPRVALDEVLFFSRNITISMSCLQHLYNLSSHCKDLESLLTRFISSQKHHNSHVLSPTKIAFYHLQKVSSHPFIAMF